MLNFLVKESLKILAILNKNANGKEDQFLQHTFITKGCPDEENEVEHDHDNSQLENQEEV